MKIKAYQTLEDRTCADDIEACGPFICNHKHAWLDEGYYFWDTNIQWAHEWGRIAYEKFDKDYTIAETQLDLGNKCFDLVGSVADKMTMIEVFEVFEKSGKIKNKNEKTLANAIRFMKKKNIFDYFSIRSFDRKGGIKIHYRYDKDEIGKEFVILDDRVQVCVINKKEVILQPLKVIYP
ncbi:MAG: hypothetical protein KUL74_02420 [Cloacibacterium sp.]|nr:hypothetical protein [Cloacibacterium sp.]